MAECSLDDYFLIDTFHDRAGESCISKNCHFSIGIVARKENIDDEPSDSANGNIRHFLENADSCACYVNVFVTRFDTHQRRHARAKSSRHHICGRKARASTMIIDGCIRFDVRAGGDMHERTVEVTFVGNIYLYHKYVVSCVTVC